MKGGVGSILCTIGEETMSILVGHFAAFKLVIAIQVILLSLPFKTMLSHPGYDVSGYWWILYLIVGMLVPILVCRLFKKKKSLTALSGRKDITRPSTSGC